MFLVTFCGESYTCNSAIKSGNTATLFLSDGGTVTFSGVTDWSAFAFDGGGWDLHELKSDKEAKLREACTAAITAGVDVSTSQGVEHFALEETDQINLTTAYNAVLSGVAFYPYHADGELCRMFTAEEITAISNASIQHKMYHTTLCNHLLTWARRAETVEELEGISYTAEGLPADLAANMAQVLGTDGGGADV